MLISTSQVLAVDLLNPTPAAEARKHKLKVRFPSPLPLSPHPLTLNPPLFSPIRPVRPPLIRGPPDTRTSPPFLLHGRKVPRLLHHHDGVLTRTDGGRVRRVQHGAVPADGREGEVDGGM